MIYYSMFLLFLSAFGGTAHTKYDKLKLAIEEFKTEPAFAVVKSQVESVSTDSLEQKFAVGDTFTNPTLVHYRHLGDSIFGKRPRAKITVGFVIFNAGRDTCIVGVTIDYFDKKRMTVELIPAIKHAGLWAYDFENMVNGYRSAHYFGGYEYKEKERDKAYNKLIDMAIYDLVSMDTYTHIDELYDNILVKRIVEKP